MRRKLQVLMLAAVIPAALALLPATAMAQGHRGGGGHPGGGAPPPSAGARPPAGGHQGGYVGRPYYGGRVYVGGYGYYGYPFWGFGWGWGYPYWGGWGWGYPYWGGGYYDPTAEVRLEVKPKEAQVYVDGYYAGIVDDFDGTFQRLRVRPGNHELTLYQKGYRTVSQNLHLGTGQDSKIKFQMEPLPAGEPNGAPPQPKSPPASDEPDYNQGMPPRQAPQRAPEPRQPAGGEVAADMGQGFGALVVRVQPSGAEVLVDGERWQGPEGAERLVIQVAEGSHRIEIRKDGFTPFSTTVQVRRGETAPINVSLPPKGE